MSLTQEELDFVMPLPKRTYDDDHDSIACPNCEADFGNTLSDWFEGQGTEVDELCDHCGENIRLEAHYSVSYTAVAVKEEEAYQERIQTILKQREETK